MKKRQLFTETHPLSAAFLSAVLIIIVEHLVCPGKNFPPIRSYGAVLVFTIAGILAYFIKNALDKTCSTKS